MVDPFFNSCCGHRVHPASYPSVLPSIIASSKTTGWNLTNLHWVARSPFKLVQRFHIYVKIWSPFQPKGNTLQSCQKFLVRFQKNNAQMVHGAPSTNIVFKLFDCFENMTTRWRNQYFYINIGETLFFYLK